MRRPLTLVGSLVLSLSLCAVGVFMTVDATTWSMVGDSFQRFLLLTVFVVAGEVFWRTVRQKAMVAAIQQRLSLAASAKITLISDFACAITPSRFGGEPARLYGLVQAGLSWGSAGVVLAGEFVTDVVVLLTALAAVALWDGSGTLDGLERVMTLRLFWLAALALSLVILGCCAILRYVQVIERWGLRALRTGLARRFLKGPTCDRAAQHFGAGLRSLRDSTALLLAHGKGLFLLSCLAALGHGLFRFAVLPVLAAGLAIDVRPRTLMIWQMIAFYGLSYTPIPGGSGALEVGFLLFFAPFVPATRLGLLLAAWRFFTYYLYLIVGGAVLCYTVRGRIGTFWREIVLRRAPAVE